MKKLTIFALLTVSLNLFADFKSELEKIRLKHNVPALGGIIIEGSKITKHDVTGVRKMGNKTLATKDDLFHLGSCTKAMQATLVATLIEKGHLKWETKITDIFTDHAGIHSTYKDVSIDMLLAHIGGTPGGLSTWEGGALWKKLWNEKLDPREGRKLIVKEVLAKKAPHKKYEYSNTGYVISGAMIEKIMNKPWEELMREYLFKPLKMSSCGFGAAGNPELENPDQPWPHYPKDNQIIPLKPNFFGDNPASTGPSGNVHCTLEDWSKFVKIHMDGLNGKDNFLKASTFKKLHTNAPGDQRYTFGGWNSRKRSWAKGRVLFHNGSNTLNYSVVWIAPKIEKAMMAVTNYAGAGEGHKATDAVIGALLGD